VKSVPRSSRISNNEEELIVDDVRVPGDELGHKVQNFKYVFVCMLKD